MATATIPPGPAPPADPVGFRAQVAVAAVQSVAGPDGGVAVGIGPRRLPQRVPGAQIRPAAGQRHGRDAVHPLHDRVIEGNRLGPAIGLGAKPQEPQILGARVDGRTAMTDHVGRMGLIGRDQVGYAHQEDARVPQEPARGEHRLRGLEIGLLAEALQRHRAGPVHVAVQFEISIPRLGTVGCDAERHERACSSRFRPFGHSGAEGIGIGDHMVRGRHQHQRVGRVLQHQRRGQDGRRRVTAHRLDDHARIRKPGLRPPVPAPETGNASPVITRGAPKPSAANRPSVI
jgi:hypothetical protein